MNCRSCGAELKENAKFCPKCGTKVEPDICPNCNAPLKAGANFCPKCGTKVNAQAKNVSTTKKKASSEDIARSEELIGKGSELIDDEKYDEAIRVLTESINLNPDNGLSFYWRGLAYLWVEEYDKAINDFTESIRLEPSYKVTYKHRGRAYYFKGEYEKARSDFNEFIANDHTDATVYNDRGNANYSLGDYSSAIKDYNKAISLKPKDKEILKTLQANLQGAEKALQNAGNNEAEEGEIEGLIRCKNCDTTISIRPNSFAMNADYECPNCKEAVAVSFWGFCVNCNEIVGFHHHSLGKTLLNIGKSFLDGFFADEKEYKRMTKNKVGGIFSKVVYAAEWGECPFCGNEYLMCPKCRKPVYWPLNSENNAVVKCECGTKMVHP